MSTAPNTIRILIADDHEMVRCGLRALLAGTELKVVAEAATGESAVELAREKPVDVALLDVRMPDNDGLTVLGRIKLDKPDLPVLMFSAFDNPANYAKAIALGASGFLLKGCSREELLDALRAVAAGETIWRDETLRSAGRSLAAATSNLETTLSDRESDVLRQMAHGLTNKQLAAKLDIGYDTVKIYVHQIFRKIGVEDRTQAALWAVRNDWV